MVQSAARPLFDGLDLRRGHRGPSSYTTATTALVIPTPPCFFRAAEILGLRENSSCRNTGRWPALTGSPLVLTFSSSTHPATRVDREIVIRMVPPWRPPARSRQRLAPDNFESNVNPTVVSSTESAVPQRSSAVPSLIVSPPRSGLENAMARRTHTAPHGPGSAGRRRIAAMGAPIRRNLSRTGVLIASNDPMARSKPLPRQSSSVSAGSDSDCPTSLAPLPCTPSGAGPTRTRDGRLARNRARATPAYQRGLPIAGSCQWYTATAASPSNLVIARSGGLSTRAHRVCLGDAPRAARGRHDREADT